MTTCILTKTGYEDIFKIIKDKIIEKFITYHGFNCDRRILKYKEKDLKITINGNIMYVETRHRNRPKHGQAYNIMNIFYDLVEINNETAIYYDVIIKRNESYFFDLSKKLNLNINDTIAWYLYNEYKLNINKINSITNRIVNYFIRK